MFQFLTHRRHSPSPSSRSSAARAPDFHTPAAAATATASPHQVERVEVRTLPPGSACLTRLRWVVPPDIYMRCDFIGRSWCRSKSGTRTQIAHTRPPIHPSPVVAIVIVAWGTSAVTETLEKRAYTLYLFPATKMVVKTLYRSVFLRGNEPGPMKSLET